MSTQNSPLWPLCTVVSHLQHMDQRTKMRERFTYKNRIKSWRELLPVGSVGKKRLLTEKQVKWKVLEFWMANWPRLEQHQKWDDDNKVAVRVIKPYLESE